ncbi:28 kDa heat- and acid-stable phosphoprotein-like isoform X2 [Hibiscus syriacus]|uniref:28 kDa heat-and acid-stable phosphoprotein-like isoform X2 n=1 Tax=Hibiscus syriacus TaxID=106335 RepID=A0A6A3BTQ9_HIBSY|nr:28 kDa heat- and acid-stable phosphoprotein-like isoform X2 [Hibiscus syriacus]
MGRGKFKAKPTGQRHFSTPEQLVAGTSTRPRTFKRQEAEYKAEEESNEESEQESGEESDDETEQKRKGTQGVIEINNPNLVKPKNLKVKDLDQGKTEQARKDLERSFPDLIRQQREEAARKKEEEKADVSMKKVFSRSAKALASSEETARKWFRSALFPTNMNTMLASV